MAQKIGGDTGVDADFNYKEVKVVYIDGYYIPEKKVV